VSLTTARLLLVFACMGLGSAAVRQPEMARAEGPPPPHIHILPPPQFTLLRPNGPQTNLSYHGGPVVHAGTVYAIYWLPAGVSTSANYQSLINRYFTDIGNTDFFRIVTQYPDTCCPPALQSVLGAWLDTTPYPRAGTTADPLLDADIEAEVTNAIAANPSWKPPGPDTAYFVYTGRNVVSCIDASKAFCFLAQYCAYHGSFVSGGPTVLYANLPDAGTDLSKCTTGPAGPNGDPEADAEISLASHEHFEIVTDSQPDVNTAWSDSMGLEIGDKCAYFYGPLNPDNSNVVLHGHPYKVQQEWSNTISECALSLLSPSVGGIAEVPALSQTSAAARSRSGTATNHPLYWEVACGIALASAALWYAHLQRVARR
jgi:hypothetical protein